RKIIFPSFFDSRPLFQKEEKVNRHHNKTEQEPSDAEKATDTLSDNVPKFVSQGRQVTLQIWNYLFCFCFQLLAFSGTDFGGGRRNGFSRRGTGVGRRGGCRRGGRSWGRLFWRRSSEQEIYDP